MPIKAIVLAGGADADRLDLLLNTADEVFQDNAQIILLGDNPLVGKGVELARLLLPSATMAVEVGRIFGTTLDVPEPRVPGSGGEGIAIPIDRLRWLEEDVDVLHTRILADSASPKDQFWRGLPPTWADLDQAADIERSITPGLVDRLRATLAESRNFTLPLYHHPAAGGTTVAYRAAWSLRQDYPTAVLRRSSANTFDRLDYLFHHAQRPVLLIADASILPPAERERLYIRLVERNARVVILYVVRVTQPDLDQAPALPETSEDGSPLPSGPGPTSRRPRPAR